MVALLALGRSIPQYPATWENNSVTIGNWRWEFNTPEFDQVFEFTLFGTLRIYANPFRALRPFVEVPQFDPFIQANVVACDYATQFCNDVTTVFDYDWRLLLNNDYQAEGVVWGSDGEPRPIQGEDEFEDWEFEWEFRCGEGSSTVPTLLFDPGESSPRLVVKFEGQRFCPIVVDVPPSPSPSYAPVCIAFFPDQQNPGRAFFVDMSTFNNGRFGYSTLIFSAPASPGAFPGVKVLIFQPCERFLACPLWDDAKCDLGGLDYSSVYVCDVVNFTWPPVSCTSYGYLAEDFVGFAQGYTLITANNVDGGFKWTYTPAAGRAATVNVYCFEDFPAHHLAVAPFGVDLQGNQLTINVGNSGACPRIGGPPEQLRDQCEVYEQSGGWTFDLRMGDYDYQVWSSEVVDTDRPFFNNFTLFYQPCGAMNCPDGYDCEGYGINAMVYLCQKELEPGQTRLFCDAYGLHRYNVTVFPTDGYLWRAGVQAVYRATNTQYANVHWRCDASLPPDQLGMPQWVRLVDGELAFNIRSSQACPVGNGDWPPEPPRWIPDTPSVPPSPVPLWSPNPQRAYFNDTHFLVFNLAHVQEEFPMRKTQTLNISGHLQNIYTEWFSWDEIPCPSDHICPGTTFWANLWECWRDKSWLPICWPVADKYVPGLDVRPLNPARWDDGIWATIPGPYNSAMNLVVHCIPSFFGPGGGGIFSRDIPIGGSQVHYWNANGVGHFLFESWSNYICPRPFSTPAVPTLKRQVVPASPPPKTFKVDGKWGKLHVGLDLVKLRQLEGTVILGDAENYHPARVIIHPAGVIPCPAGKSCGVYANDLASIWECAGRNFSTCFPIGDVRYGMNLHFVNELEPTWGLTANYLGGAPIQGETYNTHLFFVCNETSAFGVFHVEPIGYESAEHAIYMLIHTREVCPTDEWGQISGGSWFLIVVAVAALVYFGVGTLLTFAISGGVALPNEELWTELHGYFVAGVQFVFTCGGKVGGGLLNTASLTSNYSAI